MNSTSKLSKDVINQIKDFNQSYDSYYNLTKEQKSLIEELIPNEELRERFKEYRLCEECSQPKTYYNWCQSCNSKHFQQEFNKWTSENKEIDEFIQKFQLNATCKEEVLEWIPYERFKNIEYLAEGGFCTVHKAEWIDGCIEHWNTNQNVWKRFDNMEIVLKCLNGSPNLATDFLQEITFHKKFRVKEYIVPCYGISQDPKTKNFMMVTHYMDNGSIRQYLKNYYSGLTLNDRLSLFYSISIGLKEIHNKGFIHKDLHSGNILKYYTKTCYITDLGLCKPVNNQDEEKKIFGVLPYVAPEVLRGKTYTQAADIYSFGILACEIFSGLPPYHNLPHDEILALKICQGLRPICNNVNVPLLLENLIDKCLDADPSNRPTANELHDMIRHWYYKEDTEFNNQLKKADEFNKSIISKSNVVILYNTSTSNLY